MTDRERLNDFWQMIGFEQGTNRVVITHGQQRIYVDNYFLINQNGQYYIHDRKNNKLFDQYLNYYHEGRYYNRKGEIIQDIPNDNIIDIDPNDVYKHTSNDGIEYFDSDGNSLGFKKPTPNTPDIIDTDSNNKKKQIIKRGPKVKKAKFNNKLEIFETNKQQYRNILLNKYKQYGDAVLNRNGIENFDSLDDFLNILKNEDGIYGKNVTQQLGISEEEKELLEYFEKESGKPYSTIVDETYEFIDNEIIDDDFLDELNKYFSEQRQIPNVVEDVVEEVPKKTSNMTTKKLSEATDDLLNKVDDIKMPSGKLGLALLGLGIGAYILSKDDEEKEGKVQKQTFNYQLNVADTSQARYNNELMYNSYAQQMAKDISSYRYGKQMTGFV